MNQTAKEILCPMCKKGKLDEFWIFVERTKKTAIRYDVLCDFCKECFEILPMEKYVLLKQKNSEFDEYLGSKDISIDDLEQGEKNGFLINNGKKLTPYLAEFKINYIINEGKKR